MAISGYNSDIYPLDRIRGNLDVSPIRDTDIIQIKMQAPSAWEASYLANKVAYGYQALDTRLSRGEISEVVSFLNDQLELWLDQQNYFQSYANIQFYPGGYKWI